MVSELMNLFCTIRNSIMAKWFAYSPRCCSSLERVKPTTMKLVFVSSPLSMQYEEVRTDWLAWHGDSVLE